MVLAAENKFLRVYEASQGRKPAHQNKTLSSENRVREKCRNSRVSIPIAQKLRQLSKHPILDMFLSVDINKNALRHELAGERAFELALVLDASVRLGGIGGCL